MKKAVLFLIVTLMVQFLFSQDKIVLNNGDTLQGKVLEVNKYGNVTYRPENDSIRQIVSGQVRMVYLSGAKKYVYVNDFSNKLFQYKQLNFMLSTNAGHLTYGIANISGEKVFNRFGLKVGLFMNVVKTNHKQLKYQTYYEIQLNESGSQRFYAYYSTLQHCFTIDAKYYFDPYGYAQWYVSAMFEYGEIYSKGNLYEFNGQNNEPVKTTMITPYFYTGINVGTVITSKYNFYITPELSILFGEVFLPYSQYYYIRPLLSLKVGYNFSRKKH